jgi:hypothetical protein
MLNVNPETICELINMAREFHAQEGVTIPDADAEAGADWAMQVLADHADDMTLRVFQSVISDLDPDQQQEVVALMWLGRDDFTVEEWSDAVEEARANWTPETARYLITQPLLADYLLEGLSQHGYHCD